LHNNLHIAHHAHPEVSWYRLPRVWSAMREAVGVEELVVTGGYLEVMKRYFTRSVMNSEGRNEADAHPTLTARVAHGTN